MARDFYDLQPDFVMDATEAAGFEPTGEFFQLNSFENRVFKIRLEDRSQIVAKFYRPGRWTKSQIQEEHEFLLELGQEGLEVNQPFHLDTRETVLDFRGLFVSFFPLLQGRPVSELRPEDWPRVGRLLARLHNIGERRDSRFRLPMTPESHPSGWQALDLLESWVDPQVKSRYLEAASEILYAFEDLVDPSSFIRIHGDSHKGNLLQLDQQFFLVDFDDSMMGPVIQDVWMLFSDLQDFREEQELFLSGYEELRHFPEEQIDWIPALRGFRIMGYSAWIARRWTDPSFPRLFPEFNTPRFWIEETEALEKCLRQLPFC
jgi:Ser/Thr protein kinase RdoA (MazF antagonist)